MIRSSFGLKKRLFIGLLGLQFAILAVGVFSTYNSGKIIAATEPITQDSLPKTKLIADLRGYFREIRIQVRSLGFADLPEDQVRFYEKKTLEAVGVFTERLEQFRALPKSPEEELAFKEIDQTWEAFFAAGKMILSLSQAGNQANKAKLVDIFNKACPEAASKVYIALMKMSDLIAKNTQSRLDEASHVQARGNLMQWIVLALIQVLALAIGWVFIRSLIGELSQVHGMLDGAIETVSKESRELQGQSQDLQQSVKTQASTVQQTVSTLEEMSSQVHESAKSAAAASDVSEESKSKAEKGLQTLEEMVSAIQNIQSGNTQLSDAVASNLQRINEIVKVIEGIGAKTKVINEIVFQTKLLSFNASVEAARAGEHGKGFAVVAEEVGNLAQMSGNSAQEISGMLEESARKVTSIVEESKRSLESLMAENQNRVDRGSELSQECSEVLKQMVANAIRVSETVKQISDASVSQSREIEELLRGLQQVAMETRSNAELAEKGAGLASSLTEQVSLLEQGSEIMSTMMRGAAQNSGVPASSLNPAVARHGETQGSFEKTLDRSFKKDAA